MKNSSKRTIAIAGLLIMVACITTGYLLIRENNGLQEKLNESKLKSEMLLSEKLNLDRQIEKMDKNSKDLLKKIGLLSNDIENKNRKIAEKEKEIGALSWNLSKTKQMEKELKRMKDLENHINELNNVIAKLKADNEVSVNEILALQEQNRNLMENNKVLLALNTNNYRIDAVRGKKSKLTSIAKRTKKIVMGFDMPEDVVENVSFKITTPDGKVVSNAKDGLSYSVIKNNEYLLASISSQVEKVEFSKRIELTYKPQEKLLSGIYKIDIYNNSNYMGSCQIKLR